MIKATILLLAATASVGMCDSDNPVCNLKPFGGLCTPGFTNVGGSCYKVIVTYNSTFRDAKRACRRLGARVELATLRCKAESDCVYKMLLENPTYQKMLEDPSYKYRTMDAWIGLYNTWHKYPWMGNWLQDDCQKYRNFAPGAPFVGDEDHPTNYLGCVGMIHRDSSDMDSKWRDRDCLNTLVAAICEDISLSAGTGCGLGLCQETLLPRYSQPLYNQNTREAEHLDNPVCETKEFGKCKPGFHNVGGSCYKLLLTYNSTHFEAQNACKRLGPNVNLATLRCKIENDCVYNMMVRDEEYKALVARSNSIPLYSADTTRMNAWIGLYDIWASEPWEGTWSHDNCYNYRNFALGEPNNGDRNNPNKWPACVEMVHISAKRLNRMRWNDRPCHHTLAAAICEDLTVNSGRSCDWTPCPDVYIHRE